VTHIIASGTRTVLCQNDRDFGRNLEDQLGYIPAFTVTSCVYPHGNSTANEVGPPNFAPTTNR